MAVVRVVELKNAYIIGNAMLVSSRFTVSLARVLSMNGFCRGIFIVSFWTTSVLARAFIVLVRHIILGTKNVSWTLVVTALLNLFISYVDSLVFISLMSSYGTWRYSCWRSGLL